MDDADFPAQYKITTKDVFKYMALPGILPRLKNLSLVFNRLVFVFIQILGAAKLIDRNHPCLRAENIGYYKFSDIVFLAWQNVKFTRSGLPQALMFFATMGSILLTVGILLSAGAHLFTEMTATAHAQYFTAPDADTGNAAKTGIDYKSQNDWAFQFLERVFGGKAQTGLDFWIKNDNGAGANPWFSSILVGMLKAYSQALVILAVFMIIYLVVITLVDAARSGQPFGDKFDPIWAPIRFAIAIGMLMPIAGSGYNGAQMLTFQVAEWGSNLATNLWHKGVIAADQSSEGKSFVVASVADPGYRFVRDMFLINLCVSGYAVQLKQGKIADKNGEIDPQPRVTTTDDTVTYNFGIPDISPDFCGAVTVARGQEMPNAFLGGGTSATTTKPAIAARTADDFLPTKLVKGYNQAIAAFLPIGGMMQETTTEMVKDSFCNLNQNFLKLKCKDGPCSDQVKNWIYAYWDLALKRDVTKPETDYFFAGYDKEVKAYNAWLVESLKNDSAYGWASAGAFYLRMSYALSVLNNAINNQPTVSKLPRNFYSTKATPRQPKISNDLASTKCNYIHKDDPDCERYAGSQAMYELLHHGNDFFKGAPQSDLAFYKKLGGNNYDAALKVSDKEAVGVSDADDLMDPITTYIFEHFQINTKDLNPLGQVIDWGNIFVNVAGICYAAAIVASVVGIFFFAAIAHATATLFSTIGNIFIAPGFTLMFVVPLLPFMYFTFAVIEWIASIMEAVIGMPLWALSFITLEGKLLDNQYTMSGIKTLFDLILRPSIIVMSLISAVILFSAGVVFFNDAMILYMDAYGNSSASQTGFMASTAAGIGMLFVYMIGVYLLATSCFKLVDAIPNLYGRWLGLPQGIFKMDAKPEAVVLASVATVNRAMNIGLGAARLPVTEVDARRRKADHDKWRKEEAERIRKHNLSATQFNKNLPSINASLVAQGLQPLPELELKPPPEYISLNEFRDHARGGENRFEYINHPNPNTMPGTASASGATKTKPQSTINRMRNRAAPGRTARSSGSPIPPVTPPTSSSTPPPNPTPPKNNRMRNSRTPPRKPKGKP